LTGLDNRNRIDLSILGSSLRMGSDYSLRMIENIPWHCGIDLF